MSLALRAALLADGGALAAATADRGDAAPSGPAALAAAGPRAAAAPDEYALLVEAVHEGQRLHAGTPRVVTGADPDLALLGGDHLYALGLARLARLGDLAAVTELADVISLCARALAEDEPALADAAWAAGAVAVGHGPSAEHARAKDAARRGSPGAAAALEAVASARQPGGDVARERDEDRRRRG